MKNIIIAFSGKAHSGKSESSKLLKEIIEKSNDVHFVGLSFASKIKEICTYYFGWDGNKDIQNKTHLAGDIRQDGSIYESDEVEVIQDRGRQLPINVGEKFRQIRPTIWSDIVIQQIHDLDAGKPLNVVYCIDDLRFRNEIESLNKYQRVVYVRINRPQGQLYLNDITEKDLDEHRFEYQIENDGSISDLKQKIGQIYREVIKKYNPEAA